LPDGRSLSTGKIEMSPCNRITVSFLLSALGQAFSPEGMDGSTVAKLNTVAQRSVHILQIF
jgi:hypothetical protein